MKMKNKTMPIAPVFFLPVPIFIEFLTELKGAGLFKAMERKSGIELNIDPKTLRKNMKKGAIPSKKTNGKFYKWIERVTSPTFFKNLIKFSEKLIGKRIGESDWRVFIHGLKGESNQFYPKTLQYVGSLLDEELTYYNKVVSYKRNPTKLLKSMTSEPFFLKYGLELAEGFTDEVACKHPNDPINGILREKVLIESMLHGLISLNMDIFSRAEVEFFEEFHHEQLKKHNFKGALRELTPSMQDKKPSLPIHSYFKLLKEHLEFNSWNDMAEYIEMDGEGDIENKRRKLMSWVHSEHKVPVNVIIPLIDRLVDSYTKGENSSIFYIDLFFAAAFFQKLFLLVQKEANKFCISDNKINDAFSTYQVHFENHKAAALI